MLHSIRISIIKNAFFNYKKAAEIISSALDENAAARHKIQKISLKNLDLSDQLCISRSILQIWKWGIIVAAKLKLYKHKHKYKQSSLHNLKLLDKSFFILYPIKKFKRRIDRLTLADLKFVRLSTSAIFFHKHWYI